jgi:Divergent InlB B-repeat domain
MRALRAYLLTAAIFLCCIVLAPRARALPQQSTTPPAAKPSVAAPEPESGHSGWDPDWGPKKVRPAATAGTFTGPYAPGEVFISDETGLVDVYMPNGTLLGTLDTKQTLSAGMAFDRTGNLYVTTFDGLDSSTPVGVVKFGIDGNFIGPFGAFPASADMTAAPESILFNQAGDAFVGAATPSYGCPSGSVTAFEFGATGTLLNTFTVMGQCRGTDWVELLPDQKTLLYTSEGTSVLSFNTSTNTQNPDFADNLPGEVAYAFRVLPNGNLLVADTTEVVELNPSGQQVMTYTPNPASNTLFALNLDPDGTTFWTADLETGNVYRFDITSGTQVINFITPSHGASGVAIFGEKLVGQNNLTVTDAGTGTGTVTSTPSGISCPSSCLAQFPDNTSVTLTATAAAGSTFTGFSSNCVPANPQTNPPTCTVPIVTSDVNVTATFSSGTGNLTLTVTEAGDGSGTVTSTPAGIHCPTTCSANFASGTHVTLTPSPAEGSSFGGWSGACSGQGPCVVTVTAASSVTATFNLGTSVIITVPPGGSTSATTTPGGSANYGLLISGAQGVTGVVTLGCTTSSPTVSCSVIPSTITLNGKTTEVAFSIQTYCQAATPLAIFGPGANGRTIMLLLLSTVLCGIILILRRDRRVALTFALLTLMTVAAGMAACGNLAKNPSGATTPGTYAITLTATFNGQTQTLPNFLTLVVK